MDGGIYIVFSVSGKGSEANNTLLYDNQTEPLFVDEDPSVTSLISCGPAVVNQKWQMASGYIGAVLMLLMAVYARY